MGARILVIDDDRGVVDVLVACLELEGHVAIGVFRGLDGVRAVEAEGFDLVLTDYRMPDLDGVEVTRRIKALRPGIRVVLMTGHLERGLRDAALASGAEAVLEKPLPLDRVVALLEGPCPARVVA